MTIYKDEKKKILKRYSMVRKRGYSVRHSFATGDTELTGEKETVQMAGWENVHVGTSGWHYVSWSGPFYPEDLPKKDFLRYYAEHFHTVEINNSFYQLPKKETLRSWRKAVPPGFVFTVKASRYITHMKKLKDVQKALSSLLNRVEALGDKLGPVLFQLPPRWRFNPERFYDFLETLPPDHRYAVEFRDRSWQNPKAYEALNLFGIAFCIYDLDGFLSPKEVTADFVYVRLHGPKAAYQGKYDIQALTGWVGTFSAWIDQAREVFCYFDNDEAGYAVQNALRLQEMMKGR
jgi:uncharacterized protein YecE (DUF72 family)